MTVRHPMLAMRSGVAGVTWPPLVAGMPASLAALVHLLDTTQWMTPQDIADGQARQLRVLLLHAQRHSVYFRERLPRAGSIDDLAHPNRLHALPVLTRREVQDNQQALRCAVVPPEHSPVAEASSSGSSGVPVKVLRSQICQLFWQAFTLRDHLWHQRDFSGALAAIRAHVVGVQPIVLPDWGPPVALLFDTGPAHAIGVAAGADAQFDWLRRIRPDYLLSYPSNIAALLDLCERHGAVFPGLRQMRTIGEMLDPLLRKRIERVLGAPVTDMYSSQELGVIALQCPHSGLYHTMDENLVVEIVDETGKPCHAGETGRVVVTDLHNLAMPLVRYDTGDYAETGGACSCGRGLRTIRRIVGRRRNMIRIAGARRWPTWRYEDMLDVAPVRQYQLVQYAEEELELRLACDTPLDDLQKQALAEIVRDSFGHPFHVRISLHAERLPLGPNGKFEEFICLLPD